MNVLRTLAETNTKRKRRDITLKYDWLDMLDGSAMLDFKSDPALLRALGSAFGVSNDQCVIPR